MCNKVRDLVYSDRRIKVEEIANALDISHGSVSTTLHDCVGVIDILRVILCLPEKGRKEIEERVEEMKERDREERGTGMKVKKQKK